MRPFPGYLLGSMILANPLVASRPAVFDFHACLAEAALPSREIWANPPDRLRWQEGLWRRRIKLRREAERLLAEEKALVGQVKSDPAASGIALKSPEIVALRALLADPQLAPTLKQYNLVIEPILTEYLGKQRQFVEREIDRQIFCRVSPRVFEPSGPNLTPFMTAYWPQWDAMRKALTAHHGRILESSEAARQAAPGPVTDLAILMLYDQELSFLRSAAFVHDVLYVGP